MTEVFHALMQVLYAIALVPAGFLADRTDRPRMLAGGLAVWSILTMAASKVSSLPGCCKALWHTAILLQVIQCICKIGTSGCERRQTAHYR